MVLKLLIKLARVLAKRGWKF